MSLKKGVVTGKIAVVGERELVLGYRLLGVEDTFTPSSQPEAVKLVNELAGSDKYSLIVLSSAVASVLPQPVREKLEASTYPLVVFMPNPQSEVGDEPLAELAKRVLGVDLKVG
ncbi:MAG: V-type ATP synthase subunit F [Thermoprotei archaeon]